MPSIVIVFCVVPSRAMRTEGIDYRPGGLQAKDLDVWQYCMDFSVFYTAVLLGCIVFCVIVYSPVGP